MKQSIAWVVLSHLVHCKGPYLKGFEFLYFLMLDFGLNYGYLELWEKDVFTKYSLTGDSLETFSEDSNMPVIRLSWNLCFWKQRANYVFYLDLKHLIISTHCKIWKPCLSLLKIAKAMLTLHMRPRVRAPGSHLPSQLSWPIYVCGFIPSLVSLFKQRNSGPIPLSNRLLLRGSDWVQSLTRIFRSAGTAVARRELCVSKEKEKFKVKA